MSEYRSTPTAELHRDGISSKRAEPTNTIGCDLYNQPFLTKKRGRKKKRERTKEIERVKPKVLGRQREKERVNIEKKQRSFFGCDLVAGKERKKKACFSLASSYFSRLSFYFVFWCVCVCPPSCSHHFKQEIQKAFGRIHLCPSSQLSGGGRTDNKKTARKIK
jgi:hypothetical protein